MYWQYIVISTNDLYAEEKQGFQVGMSSSNSACYILNTNVKVFISRKCTESSLNPT